MTLKKNLQKNVFQKPTIKDKKLSLENSFENALKDPIISSEGVL